MHEGPGQSSTLSLVTKDLGGDISKTEAAGGLSRAMKSAESALKGLGGSGVQASTLKLYFYKKELSWLLCVHLFVCTCLFLTQGLLKPRLTLNSL